MFTIKKNTESLRTYLLVLIILTLLTLAFVNSAHAQRTRGMIGIGAQLGEQTGLSLKFYRPRGTSTEFLAAWDLDENMYFDVHAMYERHLDKRGMVHFLIGPGIFTEIFDRPEGQEDNISVGLSAKAGLGVLFNRFEVFGHVIPQLELNPSTETHVRGGVGFRFYF